METNTGGFEGSRGRRYPATQVRSRKAECCFKERVILRLCTHCPYSSKLFIVLPLAIILTVTAIKDGGRLRGRQLRSNETRVVTLLFEVSEVRVAGVHWCSTFRPARRAFCIALTSGIGCISLRHKARKSQIRQDLHHPFGVKVILQVLCNNRDYNVDNNNKRTLD